jgi:beta-glucosidase
MASLLWLGRNTHRGAFIRSASRSNRSSPSKDEEPLYAFGHGLSYTSFAYGDLEVSGGETLTASFTVTNTGKHEGTDVPQLYLTDAPGERRMRLLGFERVPLRPGEITPSDGDSRPLGASPGAQGHGRLPAGLGVAIPGRNSPETSADRV